jgi:type I restriction enzyme S subunit
MELLEQHFDTAFSASNGIQKLRELILTLAMQGKLVPQEPRDAPASQLLKEIEAEKKRLAKEGKIKAPKPLPAITPGDAPYALPQDWQWVRLGSVGNIFNGNSINASEKEAKYAGAKGLPYIATKDVGYGFNPLDYENGICIPVGEDKFRLAHEGAVLICAEGGSAGKKCGLTDRDICFGNKLFANELYGQIPSRFILYTYLSPVFRASFAAAMSGIIGGVSIAKFVEIPIPLPPLDEQHRIVAKIDQLMARCDALENLRNEREKKRLATHAASLSQLLDTTGNGSSNDAWAFITQHFGDLYAVRENVTELRKAILQLAVMGKLVPQNPNDSPASELLKKIESEKKRLVKEGKIKAAKLPPKTNVEVVPHELPAGWAWATLGEISLKVSDGFHHTPHKEVEGIKYISATHIYNGRIDWDSNLFVSEDEYLDLYKKVAQGFGDILIVNRGAGCGDAAIVDSNEKYCFQNAAIIGFDQARLCGGYILRYLHSSRDHFLKQFIQGGAQPMLSNRLIATHLIAIPPFAEQHRIVAKINQLMSLCDMLELRIANANTKQSELLDAVMAQV